MIAAVTKHNVIGRDNKIPWNYPGDFKFFREKTLDSTVIMGLNTARSLVSAKVFPLPKRSNIVLCEPSFASFGDLDYIEVYSMYGAISTARSLEKDIWFIGGGSIYAQGLKYADEIVLSIIPDDIPIEGSVLFPILIPGEWGDATCEPHPYEKNLKVITYRKLLK